MAQGSEFCGGTGIVAKNNAPIPAASRYCGGYRNDRPKTNPRPDQHAESDDILPRPRSHKREPDCSGKNYCGTNSKRSSDSPLQNRRRHQDGWQANK